MRLKRKAVPSPPPPLAVQEKEAAKEPPLPEAAYRPADYTTVYIVGGIAAAGLIAYFLLK
ncbi:MAG: hypothetical protein GTO22_05415 [Gemmatimonadales bacterium]|nr:hypothetical protein [Gemmatimonadales bacterium]